MINILVDLNSACSDYAVANSLNLLYKIFKMVCVIVPIILIVFASINMGKLMINPDDKKGIGGIANRIIAAIIVFMIPNLLDIVAHFNTLTNTTNTNFNVLSCFSNSETSSKAIGLAVYKEGAGTEKGTGLSGMFGDLSGLKNYTSSSVAGEGAQKLINIAKKEIGNNESDGTHMKYETYMGFGGSDPWCAMFVSWCANEAGFIDSGIIPKYASCSDGVSWFESKNQFHREGTGYTPQPGDIVFFGAGGGSHTGIVVSADANNVYTIEGNTSDMVAEKTRPRATGYVYGYGTPAY
mgnify:CR=1 FL=1